MARCPTGQRRSFVALVSGGLALALAFVDPVAAEDAGRLDSALKTLKLKAEPGRAPDFIEQSRASAPDDYVPIGQPHPERGVKVKSPAELVAAEAELDALRARHDRIAGRKPPVPGRAGGKLPGVKTKPPVTPVTTQN